MGRRPSAAAALTLALLAATGTARGQQMPQQLQQIQQLQIQQLQSQQRAQRLPLVLGDDAPPLPAGRWLRGDPVEELDRGRVYAIQFWQPGRAESRVTLPAFDALAGRYPDVTFVAVTPGVRSSKAVEAFLTRFLPDAHCHVATDAALPGSASNQQQEDDDTIDVIAGRFSLAASRWQTLAIGRARTRMLSRAIPLAFIVNADGVVVWVGGPMRLEAALKRVLAGKYELAAARRQSIDRAAAPEQEAAMMQELSNPGNNMPGGQMDPKRVAALYDTLADRYPAARIEALCMKFAWQVQERLPHSGDEAAAREFYATTDALAEAAHALGDADLLNEVSWGIVSDLKLEAPDAARAERYAQWAVEDSDGTSGAILDTLARAQFLEGKFADAVSNQTKALAICDDGDERDHVGQTLAEYKRVAATRPSK